MSPPPPDRFRELFMDAPAFIAILRGPELRFELVNRLAMQLLQGREVEGRPIREALPELEGQGIVPLLERAYSTGESVLLKELTARLGMPDGTTREIRVTGVAVPLRESGGRIEGVMTLSYDVTDQVEIRAMLQQARERAERAAALLASMHDVSTALARALTEEEAAEIAISEGSAALGADTGSFFVGRGGVLELVRHRGLSAERANAVRTLPLDSGFPVARVMRTGEACWAEAFEQSAVLLPDLATVPGRDARAQAFCCLPLVLGGETYGVLSFGFHAAHPFSEEERAILTSLANQCARALERARLYEREQQTSAHLRLLAEASVILASSLDFESTLTTLANMLVPHYADWCAIDLREEGQEVPHAVAIAHADPAKMEAGRALRDRYPPRPGDVTGVMNVLRTGEPELHPEVPDAALVAYAIDAEHLAILRDVGMRSAVIIPLKAHGDTLGTITLARTGPGRPYTADDARLMEDVAGRAALAVSNARLHREAREAVRMRDEFLSIASHELNTPLTSLRLIVESLRRGKVAPEKIPAKLESAERQVSRLTNLVHDLLDVSRIVDGNMTLAGEEVDLGAIVRDVISRFSDQLSRAASTLDLRVAPGVIGRWDPGRIEQVVVNLVSNAVKYGAGKPIDVYLSSDGVTARLLVRDRGIGIAPENQARIFQRFERAVSSRHYGGFGLGLWIARQAIEASGGTIHVDSAPGEGSTFEVVLPLRPAAGPHAREPRVSRRPSSRP